MWATAAAFVLQRAEGVAGGMDVVVAVVAGLEESAWFLETIIWTFRAYRFYVWIYIL